MATKKKQASSPPVTNWQGNSQNVDQAVQARALKKLAAQAASRDTGLPVAAIEKGTARYPGSKPKPKAKKKGTK